MESVAVLGNGDGGGLVKSYHINTPIQLDTLSFTLKIIDSAPPAYRCVGHCLQSLYLSRSLVQWNSCLVFTLHCSQQAMITLTCELADTGESLVRLRDALYA